MKTNHSAKNKGWHKIFFLVILVLQIFFIETVSASEEIEENFEKETIVEENATLEEDSNISEESTEEILEFETREELWNHYSENMEFTLEKVIIQNKINEEIKIEEILKDIQIETLKQDYHILEVYIIDELGNILKEEDILSQRNTIIFLGENYISQYSIELLGDYNKDSIINSEDIDEALEENILDQENVTTEEVSYIDYIVNNNTYETPTSVPITKIEDTLKLENNEIYIEDELKVNYNLKGITNQDLNTISAELEYDDSALELVDIYWKGNKIEKGKVSFQYFITLINEHDENSPFLTLIFKAHTSGDHQITLKNIKIANNGILLTCIEATTLEFFVQEYGKGGDVEPETPTDQETNPTTNTSTDLTQTSSSSPLATTLQNHLETSNIQQTEIKLSSNNSIKSLKIKGYSISFDKDQTNYQIEIENNIEELIFEIKLSDQNATYFITGNENLKVGKNNIVLTVQAEDGSTKDYLFEVTKKEAQEPTSSDTEEKIKTAISLLILGLLILSVISCLYRFIKKENE